MKETKKKPQSGEDKTAEEDRKQKKKKEKNMRCAEK